MDIESAKKLTDILINNSASILRAGFGVNAAESSFFSVIELLKKNNNLKSYMLSRIKSTLEKPDSGLLDQGMIPRELIELIAHEMRWVELRDLADKRVHDLYAGHWEQAVHDISQGIVEALSDNWQDREFYSRYK